MKNNQPKLKHWPYVIMLFLILCHICAGCCYSYHNLIIMRFESNPNMFDFRFFFLLLAVHDVRVSVFPNMVLSDTQQPKQLLFKGFSCGAANQKESVHKREGQ